MTKGVIAPFSAGAVGLMRRLFGPAASEIGEMFADKVRNYRSKNLEKVFDKAAEKVGDDELDTLPLRFAIPFAERASLAEDEEIAEMWANLLSNAARAFEPEHISFINILARLSPAEAEFLDQIVPHKLLAKSDGQTPDFAIFKSQNDGARDAVADVAEIVSRSAISTGKLSEEGKQVAKKMVEAKLANLIIESMTIRFQSGDGQEYWSTSNPNVEHKLVSIDLLQAEGLVQRGDVRRAKGEIDVTASVVHSTALGWMFVQTCRSTKEETK